TIVWLNKHGIYSGPSKHQVNCMQRLLGDVMDLLNITNWLFKFRLAPGYESWPALNKLRDLVSMYTGRDDWKQAHAYWSDMKVWRGLAYKVFECGREALAEIIKLISRVEFVAMYEGIVLGVGSVWVLP